MYIYQILNPVTKTNTCKSEGKSRHNLTVNSKTAMVQTSEKDLHQLLVFRRENLSHIILRLITYEVNSITNTECSEENTTFWEKVGV